MRAHLPPPPDREPEPRPDAAPGPPVAAKSRRRAGLVAAALLLAVGGGVWWWFRGSEKPADPPLPPDISDREVKHAVEQSRAKVLAEPGSGSAWGQYGLVLLGNLFDREADACFARAAELAPTDPRWPYGRALIALKRRPEEAPEFLRQTAATGDAEYRAVANLTLAETLLERREIDAAAELFRPELGTGGVGEARATFGMALVALARGDDAEAARLFDRVRDNPYCRKQAAVQLATLARALGEADAARRFETEANALPGDPPWPDPILDHVLELQAGQRGRERRIARYERDGRYHDAAQEYLTELSRERTPKALTGAAANLHWLGRDEEAVKLLREAIDRDSRFPHARYTLALVLLSRAKQEWDRNPDSASARAGFQEVVEQAKRATELKPDQKESYWFWAVALRHLGNPKAAIEPLRKGLIVHPDDFELHLELGRSLAAGGDSGAAAQLEIAKKLRPNDPRVTQELAKLKK